MAHGNKVLVGQSGGPTAAINASLAGVFSTASSLGLDVIGMRYGIQGLLDGRTVRLSHYLSRPLDAKFLRMTPASWLGSCRYKLPDVEQDDAPYRQLMDIFGELGVGSVLYIGGNDSMDTIHKLSLYGDAVGSPIRFVGVPKTIDNDLVGTDHTPGFGSAAKFIATTMAEVARDSDVYDLKSVTFVEIMGRDAGWLAGSACLAGTSESPCPDLVLLPEAPVTEDQLIERLSMLLGEKNTVVVAVSEGLRRPDGTLMCEQWERAADGSRLDAFGHVASLSDTSRYLASVVRSELGCKTRAVELSTLQRCASHIASATDLDEAFRQGGAGVLAASDGRTGVMCALERMTNHPYVVESVLADVHEVANKARPVPRDWIAEDGMSVTSRFEDYARPLIGGEVSQVYIDGIPRHIESL